jgi:glutamyl-tRNA synthetase
MFHIGSARTAIFNWLIAKATQGTFILRIDDTDTARNTQEAEQVILDAMDWMGLTPDVTFKQSERLTQYRELAQALVEQNLAVHDGEAIRLTYSDPCTSWTDTVSGKISITDNDRKVSDGLVLMRSDGNPTYHFASVVDDMEYGVTWVVRGSDHMSNTSKHIAIWHALSHLAWPGANTALPLFTHVGLITQNGKKISKRDGSASLLDYRDRDVNPDAMFNWLLRLGWGPTVDDKTTAKISRERAVELFLAGGKMKASPANMDLNKLDSFDRKYKAVIESALKL